MVVEIVDIHGHCFPPGIVDTGVPRDATPAVAANWSLLTDLDRQLEVAAQEGTDVRVLSAPLGTIVSLATVSSDEVVPRTNDALAGAVAKHGGRVRGWATIDAFTGDAAAEEARRAIDDLGLAGLLVDAVQGERLLSDPETRPVLAFAAERGVPVFAHPVNPSVFGERYRRGGAGVLLARGSESALSTLALLASGTIAELDGLQLIVAGIGAAALFLAPFLDGPDAVEPLPSAGRSRLYVDTMGFDPAIVRGLVELLGADHVLVGSDWPIMWRSASADRVQGTLQAAGLAADRAALVAGGNAVRLLAPASLPAV